MLCWKEQKLLLYLIPIFSTVSSGISLSPLLPKLWLIHFFSMQQWNCWSKRIISVHVLLCLCIILSNCVFVSAECLAENSFSLLNWSVFTSVCSLQENAIGNEGVTFLANALKGNTTLRTLWFVF